MDLTIRDHASDATRPPVVTTRQATLRTVAHQLWEQGVGAAAVVDDSGHVVGIVSERDIVARLAQGDDPDTISVDQAMTNTVASARPDDRLLEVVFLMAETGVRHIPVIDENATLTGMVSIRDMVRPLLVTHLGG